MAPYVLRLIFLNFNRISIRLTNIFIWFPIWNCGYTYSVPCRYRLCIKHTYSLRWCWLLFINISVGTHELHLFSIDFIHMGVKCWTEFIKFRWRWNNRNVILCVFFNKTEWNWSPNTTVVTWIECTFITIIGEKESSSTLMQKKKWKKKKLNRIDK